MGKKWIVISALTVALVGVMGGAALAQTEDSNGDSPFKSLVARVAEKLGLDEATVQEAFDESRDEIREELIERKLDRLVENGTLTQGEADEYAEWLGARPDVASNFGGFRGFGRQRHGRLFGGFGNHGGGSPPPLAPLAEGTVA